MKFTIEDEEDVSVESVTIECAPEGLHYFMQWHRVVHADDLPLQSLLFCIEGDGTDEWSLAERAVLALMEWFDGPGEFVKYIEELAKRRTDAEVDFNDCSRISRELMAKYPKST